MCCSVPGLQLDGHKVSPVIHLRLRHPTSPEHDKKTLEKMAATVSCEHAVAEWRVLLSSWFHSQALDDGVSLCVAKYLEDEEKFLPPPR